MWRELFQKYSLDPKVIAAIGALLFLIVLLLFLRSRKRKKAKRGRQQSELWALEQRKHFTDAAASLHESPSLIESFSNIASLLREHLAIELLAIYGGKEKDELLEGVMPKLDQRRADLGHLFAMLPPSIASAILREYFQPQIVPLDGFLSHATGGAPAAQYIEMAAAAPAEAIATGGGSSSSILGLSRSPGTGSVSELGQPNIPVVIWVWHGPFGWHGLAVAKPEASVSPEVLINQGEGLSKLGSKLGIAFELVHDQTRMHESEDRKDRIVRFTRSLVRNLDEPSPLPAISQSLSDLMGANSSAIWRVDHKSSTVKMVEAYSLLTSEFLPVPIGQGLAGRIAESKEILAIDDAPSDSRCLFPRETKDSGIVSYLGAPVLVEGEAIGVIEVHTRQARAWSASDALTLKSAAEIVSEVMRSLDARSNRLRVESAYLGLSEALQRLRSRDEVMEAAVEVLGHALGVSRVAVVEFDEQRMPLPIKYEFCASNIDSLVDTTFSQEFAERVTSGTTGGRPIVIHNSHDRSLIGSEIAKNLGIFSELALPVRQKGQTLATIYVHQGERQREWQREEVEFADRVGRQVSLSLATVHVLESVAIEAQLAQEEARRAAEMSTRARAFIDALPESVIWLDPEGRVTFFNASARDLLGLKNEDVGHMADMTEALAMADEDLWELINVCSEVTRFRSCLLAARLPMEDNSGYIDGSEAPICTLPVSISVAPVRQEQGQIAGRILVLSDISHIESEKESGQAPASGVTSVTEATQKELNELRETLHKTETAATEARAIVGTMRSSEEAARKELVQIRNDEARARKSAQQLLEINRLKNDFISNAGKEMQSSLQSALGYLKQLQEGQYGSLSPEQAQIVQGIYAWSHRMEENIFWLMEYGITRAHKPDKTEADVPKNEEEIPPQDIDLVGG